MAVTVPSATTAHTPAARFSLKGDVLDAAYTSGRNTGNTFRQTDGSSTVHGVPVKGPYVGQKFPVERYVAMPIGNHDLYVAWLDTRSSSKAAARRRSVAATGRPPRR